MKRLSVIILLLLISACKDENNSSKESKENNEVEITTNKVDSENKLIVEMTLKTNQDGLFYTSFVDAGIDNKSVVKYQNLKASNEFQKFRTELDLNENQIPKRIILFLGQETPKTIIIKDILLASDDIEISGTDISKYFLPNSFVKYYKGTDSISTIKVDDRHVPTLTLNTKALDSLLY